MAANAYYPYGSSTNYYGQTTGPYTSNSTNGSGGYSYDWQAGLTAQDNKKAAAGGTGGTGVYFPKGEDVYPWSKSTTKSTSYSGLSGGYSDQLMEMLYPLLQPAIENYIPNIDKYTSEAFGMYNQSMNNMLTEMLPDILGEYGNKGVLSSTVMSDALSDTSTNLARTALEKQYDTAMQAALLKTQLPTMLGQLMNLGKVSTSEGGTTSYSEDQTQMYQIIAQMLSTLMS